MKNQKNRKNRIISTVTAVFMMMTVFAVPLPTVASTWNVSSSDIEYAVTGGNIYFDTSTGTITGCDVGVTKAELPKEIEGVSVTSIGDRAFENCAGLTSITIPDSVISIGDDAFVDCDSLASITIPDSVTSIGDSVFYHCDSLTNIKISDNVTSIGNSAFENCAGLTSITIPDSVTSIGDDAFDDCDSLVSITIPDNVTRIGEYAFYNCNNLTNITISYNVTNIGDYAFYDCDSLTSISVNGNNQYYSSKDGALFNKNQTKLIQYPIGDTRTGYIIPNGVTSIGKGAFNYCRSLTSITIPEGVTSIGEEAFGHCRGLTNITIPDSVTSIGKKAFIWCSGLTSITIPDNVTSIGEEAFCLCDSLKSIYVNENNQYYSSKNGVMFNKNRTELIQYPLGNTRTEYIIPNGVTSIADYAFEYCSSLTSITIPDSVTWIGHDVFYGCGSFTIYGYAGSYAETYAADNDIPFAVIEITTAGEYKSLEEVNVDLAIENGSVKLFEDAQGGLGDESIGKIFPGDYDMEFPFIKTSISKETQNDGTYKLKMAIGADENIVFGSEKGWENLKEDIEDVRKNINKTKQMKAYLDKWGKKGSGDSFGISKFEPDLSVIGYYEMIFDENGKMMAESGGAIVEAALEASYTQQCVVVPIPIPFYVEIGGSLSAEAQGALEQAITSDNVVFTGEFSINPQLMAGVGAGISGAATIGVRGKGGLDIQVVPASKGAFTAGAYLTAEALLVFDVEVDIVTKTYPLWDTTKRNAVLNSFGGQVQQDGSFTLVDRNYQNKTSSWNGEAKTSSRNLLRTTARQNEDASIETLQEYILPNTIPRMTKVGSDTVMIFHSNDADRETQDSVKLMYSVYDGTSWSEPVAISDDGTLDTFFDVALIQDELYVVWQNNREKITGADTNAMTKEAARTSEICWTKYDATSGVFEEAAYITDNESYDFIPTFAEGEEAPSVLWVNSDNEDITGMTGTKEIKVTSLNGEKWSEPVMLSSTKEYIVQLAGSSVRESNIAAYITIDGNNQQKLYKATDGTEEVIYDGNAEQISGLRCSGERIVYNQSGVLKEYSIADGSVSELTAGTSSAISANAMHVNTGEKTALIWMSNEADGCAFYSSVKTGDSYSEPILLYRNAEVTGNYFAAVLDDRGAWEIVFNGTDAEDSEKTSMYFLTKKSVPQLQLEGIVINENEAEGTSQPVSYTVTNNSEETINSYDIAIKTEDDQLVSKTVTCDLLPGETIYVEDAFDTEGLDSIESIEVQTVAEGQIEEDGTTAEKTISLEDIALSVTKEMTRESAVFTATVTNDGQTETEGTVTLYGDAEEERVVCTEAFERIAPGESTEVTLEYPAEEMVFTAMGSAYCRIKATCELTENNESNNVYHGITYSRELPSRHFSLGNYEVSGIQKEYIYAGKAIEPDVVIKKGSNTLVKDTDYKVSYSNNINHGTATVTITGIGNYTGTIAEKFTISPANIGGKAAALSSTSYTYDGKAKTPTVTIAGLKEGADFTVAYSNNINPGTAGVTITGTGNYTGTIIKTFAITKANQTVNKGEQTIVKANQTIKGASKFNKVYGNKAFKLGASAVGKLTYKTSNKKVATVSSTGKVTIKNTGRVVITIKAAATETHNAAVKKVTINVSPKKVASVKAKSVKKKKATISWKRDKKATGYQIVYSTDKKFKKGVKKVNISKNKTVKKTISKLKSKKTYYVKVRAYKKVGSTKIYGSYSKAKKIKVK